MFVKDEEIDYELFLTLNAGLFYQMGIKMGQSIKLQSLIEKAKVRCISVFY